MSEYVLPSGLASLEYSGSILGEEEYRYPIKRKDLEKALQEALYELWKINSQNQ